MVNTALEAADELASSGIEVEIIDPRTTSPLDTDTNPRCSLAADIAALAAQEVFGALRAPTQQVTARTRPCRSPTRWKTCSSRTPRASPRR